MPRYRFKVSKASNTENWTAESMRLKGCKGTGKSVAVAVSELEKSEKKYGGKQ